MQAEDQADRRPQLMLAQSMAVLLMVGLGFARAVNLLHWEYL